MLEILRRRSVPESPHETMTLSPASAPMNYGHADTTPQSDGYLLPKLLQILARTATPGSLLFDVGAGNGQLGAALCSRGYRVIGIEPSRDGVEHAKGLHSDLNIELGSAYEDLASRFGIFRVLYSIEVVEHLYDPRLFTKTCFNMLEPGGVLILSTPYHGYAKNLLLALTGKMDDHFTALWDHGHIKFWSKKTLTNLLSEAGFDVVNFEYAGRFHPFSKSMFAIARKPSDSL